jgi:hypothetical protein
MPWTPSQHRLFEAAAHNASIAKRVGIPQAQAARMASEGVKSDEKRKALAAGLRGKSHRRDG